MSQNIRLLTDEQLLLEETSVKEKLFALNSEQRKMPHSSFVAMSEQLNARLESVYSELERRKLL